MTASEISHPTGDPGTGVDIKTRRPRTDPDLVADVAAAETGKTAEVEVGVGEMFQPRNPTTNTDRKIEAVRTDRKEVSQRRKKN